MVAVVTSPPRRAPTHPVRPATRVGGQLYRRPEWSVAVVVVVAWIGFVWLAWGPAGHGMAMAPTPGAASAAAPMTGHAVGNGATAPDWVAMRTYLRGVTMWTVMVGAMMLPATVPLVRHVAFATRRTRRQRSIALLCLGYLLGWLPLGAVTAVWHLLDVPPRAATAVAVVALIVAGVWELTPMKVRAMRRCHRTLPIRYSGRAADRSALQLGVMNGQACVFSCGPAMVALVVLGHPVVATVLVAAVMLVQATHRRADHWRGYVAALAFIAACVVLAG